MIGDGLTVGIAQFDARGQIDEADFVGDAIGGVGLADVAEFVRRAADLFL
jgi:hypothetical protein